MKVLVHANFGGFDNVIDVPENSYKCFLKYNLHKLQNKDISMTGAREAGGSVFILASGAKILNTIQFSDSNRSLKDASRSHSVPCS